MFIGAVGFVLFDWLLVWPRIRQYRDEYVEHADEPEIANPANDEFNRFQRESELLLRIRLGLLLALILFSASITPRKINIEIPAAHAGSEGSGLRVQRL